MTKRIAGADLPNFSDIDVPKLTEDHKREMDAVYSLQEASYAKLAKSVKDANDAKEKLTSIVTGLMELQKAVMPLLQRYLVTTNVPEVQQPNKARELLSGLLGVAQTPAEGRPQALIGLLQGLL